MRWSPDRQSSRPLPRPPQFRSRLPSYGKNFPAAASRLRAQSFPAGGSLRQVKAPRDASYSTPIRTTRGTAEHCKFDYFAGVIYTTIPVEYTPGLKCSTESPDRAVYLL